MLQACLLLARENLTDTAIAEKVGVNPLTIGRWKRHPDFIKKIQEEVAILEQELRSQWYANRAHRLEAYNSMIHAMHELRTARAEDPHMADVPGGRTGLLVRRQRMIGKGKDITLVWEYENDTGLEKEMREYLKQMAQEVGQWTEKKDLTSGGAPIKVIGGIDMEAL